MDLEELYAPNHIERLKARSFLRSIAFLMILALLLNTEIYLAFWKISRNLIMKKSRIKMICIFCANLWIQP